MKESIERIREELNKLSKKYTKLSGEGTEELLKKSEELDREVYKEQIRRYIEYRESKKVLELN